ncbi:MAG: hypothetical protein F6J96_13130 [Symploca sp. SIO1C2]|nr:hypothetical protein [Symploca sp. SIO1C2]
MPPDLKVDAETRGRGDAEREIFILCCEVKVHGILTCKWGMGNGKDSTFILWW